MRKPNWLWTMAMAAIMAAIPALAQESAEQQVMDLANQDRAQQGLAPLKWDPALAQAAGQPDLAARLQAELKQYEAGLPIRQ